MKIINCKIENFGKISNQQYEFNDGLNTICENNGWGKSTLAAFIRVMLYGFDNEGKRDLLSNERKRYKPWQGGTYGGSLTFETEGKQYAITRIFGSKAAEDTFELRDTITNLPSSDYSSNIGEELFKIDALSYERTVFISQNDCDYGVTDSVNAKLGNLAENMDDINNYENVSKKLTDLINSMSPRRSTGSINRLKNRITELRASVNQAASIDNAIEELNHHREQELEQLNNIKAEQKRLNDKRDELAKQYVLESRKKQYEAIANNFSERKAAMEHSKAAFPDKIPSEAEIDVMLEQYSTLVTLKGQKESLKLTDDELMELDRLDSTRENEPTVEMTDRAVSEWNIRNDRKRELDILESRYAEIGSQAESMGKSHKIECFIGIFAGVILLIFGLLRSIIGLTAVGIALIIVPLFIFFMLKGKADKAKHDSNRIAKENLDNLKALEKEISDMDMRMKEFFASLNRGFDESTVIEVLYNSKNELIQNKSRYSVLQNKEKAYYELCERFVQKENELKTFFAELSIRTDDMQAELLSLKNRVLQYAASVREYETALSTLKKFEEENKDIKDLTQTEQSDKSETESTEETKETISHRMTELEQSMDVTATHIAGYDKELDALREKRDNISEDELELQDLLERYDEDMKQYGYIQKTKELLTKAKENFTARYMQPLQNGFAKYFGILAGVEADNYHLDANARLTVEESGMQREIPYLSSGYRDLAGICMRMALADAMYTKEKPMLIFDDPFVNLDGDKINGGMELISKASEEYQIIYFTCHESRKKLG